MLKTRKVIGWFLVALTTSVLALSSFVSADDGDADLLARAQAIFKPLPETAGRPIVR